MYGRVKYFYGIVRYMKILSTYMSINSIVECWDFLRSWGRIVIYLGKIMEIEKIEKLE